MLHFLTSDLLEKKGKQGKKKKKKQVLDKSGS